MSVPDSTHTELPEKESRSHELSDSEEHSIRPEHGTDLELHAGNQNKVIVYLKGWRLHTLTLAYGRLEKVSCTTSI